MDEDLWVCPHCENDDLVMVGDPEYNDLWECEKCHREFGTPKTIKLERN